MKRLICCLLLTAFTHVCGDNLQVAQDLRESGKTLEAIDLYNQMIVEDQFKNDFSHLVNAMTGRLISWRHLFIKTKAPLYAILVEKEAEAIAEIVSTYYVQNHDHLVHYLLAQAAVQRGDYQKAATQYAAAIQDFPGESGEKGDWMAHLGNALYISGKKEEGKEALLKGIEILGVHKSETEPFIHNVWVSGAYLRLYENLKNDEPTLSEQYLTMAKEIINSDERLVVRKQQLP